MPEIRCPNCAKMLRVADSQEGEIGVCPGCKRRFPIPALNGGGFEIASLETDRPPQEDGEHAPHWHDPGNDAPHEAGDKQRIAKRRMSERMSMS